MAYCKCLPIVARIDCLSSNTMRMAIFCDPICAHVCVHMWTHSESVASSAAALSSCCWRSCSRCSATYPCARGKGKIPNTAKAYMGFQMARLCKMWIFCPLPHAWWFQVDLPHWYWIISLQAFIFWLETWWTLEWSCVHISTKFHIEHPHPLMFPQSYLLRFDGFSIQQSRCEWLNWKANVACISHPYPREMEQSPSTKFKNKMQQCHEG